MVSRSMLPPKIDNRSGEGRMTRRTARSRLGIGRISFGAILLASTTAMAFPAHAQDSDAGTEEAADEDTIVVTGLRETIRDSIATKRNNDLIVDALVADEIGDLPALSIGEALETLTGAGS